MGQNTFCEDININLIVFCLPYWPVTNPFSGIFSDCMKNIKQINPTQMNIVKEAFILLMVRMEERKLIHTRL
jgi:hypothetical protein